MSKENIIQTKNLTKYYGKSLGIENLNLEIFKGEIFGLLGPNGAGKTTTCRLLLDLIYKTSGTAKIFNLDVHHHSTEIRQRTAYLPGDLGLYQNKTAKRNLQYLLGLYENHIVLRRIEELAEIFSLDLDRKVKELSKGNKQKVGIILALAPEVELLILDEPTSGLDPLITAEFYNILHKQQKETGSTVLLSSHLLGEVERVAHRVGIIREGKIVEVATIQQLRNMAMKEIKVDFKTKAALKQFSEKIPTGVVDSVMLNETHASFMISREDLSKILNLLSQSEVIDIDVTSPTLEDIFLKYYETSSSRLESLDNSKDKIEVEG
ncbi:MAG: ABC transporter ATP-binding protein [Candidatus Lokiarchaeota archaeon]|nr:ABC transporter ATP-binding protein [Candidatus Lokiarchaeota archaeon]